MHPNRSLVLAALALGTAACAADPDICQQAIDVIEECTGAAPDYPAEGCVESYAASAAEVVEQGCAATAAGGKADEWWCGSLTSWLGMCELDRPLEEVIEIDELGGVCPSSRTDPLCRELTAAAALPPTEAGPTYERARRALVGRLAREPRDAVLRDAAVRYYIRERALGLTMWNIVTGFGAKNLSPAEYDRRADEALKLHLPHYDAARFHLAHTLAPIRNPKGCRPQALLLAPGVIRGADRKEFKSQTAQLARSLPCVHAIYLDSGSFVDPHLNAEQARLALASLDAELGVAAPVHMVGYSQGATNVLTTLVENPAIAARTVSVVTLNSAAGGSEVGDLFHKFLSAIDQGDDPCADDLALLKPVCEWATKLSPVPGEFVLKMIAKAMGVPVDQLKEFIASEDGVSAAPDLVSFFRRHIAGVASLTTAQADQFWAQKADALPMTALYLTFASIITDESRNLPLSNKVFFSHLARAGHPEPYNDMQVRLPNQRMRAPVDQVEVKMPVAEGNHWQWVLNPGAVPPSAMPLEMARRIPQPALMTGIFQAFYDVGMF